jgi:hypothetical protein
MRQPLRLLGEKLRFHHAVAGRPFREAGVPEECPVEAEQRRHADDLELVESAQHPPPRLLAVVPVLVGVTLVAFVSRGK